MGALKSSLCSKGHPMSDPNLYYRTDGKRECLACKNERNRATYANGYQRKDRGLNARPTTPRKNRINPTLMLMQKAEENKGMDFGIAGGRDE